MKDYLEFCKFVNSFMSHVHWVQNVLFKIPPSWKKINTWENNVQQFQPVYSSTTLKSYSLRNIIAAAKSLTHSVINTAVTVL